MIMRYKIFLKKSVIVESQVNFFDQKKPKNKKTKKNTKSNKKRNTKKIKLDTYVNTLFTGIERKYCLSPFWNGIVTNINSHDNKML